MEENKFHILKYRIYILVWVGLVMLTGITVSAAGLNLGRLSVAVVLTIAGLKSGLVLNYFMHLKYERRLWLFKLMIPGIIILLILFIGLTFFDVALR